jgi:hypothetical protein
MRRVLFCGLVALLLSGVVAVSSSGAGERRLPEVIQLPVGFQPEGIATGDDASFFVGSIPTGAVFRGNFKTGTGSVLVPGHSGRAAAGVAFDERGERLFVAGGPTGKAFVYDAESGEDVATLGLTTTQAFINDVVLTRGAAWFTDSFNKVLYRVAIARNGSLGAVQTVPLSGDIVYQPGFNANGIDAARHGKALVIVQSNTGKLFTVKPDTGVTREIDLGGEDVVNGDGILLRGSTLFVVQNFLNRVAVVKLERDLRAGEVVRHITDTELEVPTTIDEFAGRLWAVNARFGVPSPETAQYQVVQLRITGDRRHESDDGDESDESQDDDESGKPDEDDD